MRVMIAAVGRLKSGPERDLAERYLKRAGQTGRSVGLTGLEVIEIRESRADNPARRMLEESIAIASVIPDRAVTVLMDERGESMPSAAFAGRLQAWRAEDKPAVVFVIGGADGLAPGLLERADERLAFGRMTWPHRLVRVMLLEQIYRAQTILAGHPYHRD
jgi:23S rRNA (pseudouridine1915-N3)-methyltransferase